MESATVSPQDEFVQVVNAMTASVMSAHAVLRTLLEKHREDPEASSVKDGISLLSMKNYTLMSYLQSLALLTSHRALGHSLLDRTPPSEPFASSSRKARGSDAGDLVDSLVESRAILEKAKNLEVKMKYQIDKLVRMGKDAPENGGNADVISDPLAFKPNPNNLADTTRTSRLDNDDDEDEGKRLGRDDSTRDEIYRPPRIAPVHFDDESGRSSSKRRRDGPLPTALASLANYNPSNPYVESNTGLGNDVTAVSRRQKHLNDMTRFEEEHMTRLVMKKSEARRRMRDEHDAALGGSGNTGRFGRAGDFEGEFADVLKSIDRGSKSKMGDGYDSLRMKGKKGSLVERSRGHIRKQDDLDFGDDGEDSRWKKKSRFEKDVRKAGKRKHGRK
ncbi:hypothetical protein FRB90_001971 [Tulasnella sp. 427]|nr:hypothetical protein FRB90_001971 [Tulasnella sp. 427]